MMQNIDTSMLIETSRQLAAVRRELDEIKRREKPVVAHKLQEATYRRSLQDHVSERISIFDIISDKTKEYDIKSRNASVEVEVSDALNVLLNSSKPGYVPAGKYHLNETYGSGRSAYTALATYDNADIIFDTGAQFFIGDQAVARPVIFREIENFAITGGEFIDARTVKRGTGVSFENCKRGFVQRMVTKFFGGYGFAVTEDTSAPIVSTNTIWFEAFTHRIYDDANGLTEFRVGDRVYVSTTLYNNGIKNIIRISDDGHWVEVSETVVDETGGSGTTYIISSGLSIASDGESGEVYDAAAAFAVFLPDDLIQMSGWTNASNNGVFTVMDVTPGGYFLKLYGSSFVTEAAGATVTISKVGNARLQVIRTRACNEMSFLYNTAIGIGAIGFEMFTKSLSDWLFLFENTAYSCGYAIPGGTGIKVGTNYISLHAINNRSHHCWNGINIGNWISHYYMGNEVINFHRFGYAMTASKHPLSQDATYDLLAMSDNRALFVNDFGPDKDRNPVISTTPFVPRSSNYAAINLNGLYKVPGIIDLNRFMVKDTSRGWTLDTSRVRHPNLHLRNSTFVNAGNSLTITLEFTGTVTNGSPVITGLTNTKTSVTGTAGWYAGSGIHIKYFPDETEVLSVDPVAGTITLTQNASGVPGGSAVVAFYSGTPDDFDHDNNRYINTEITHLTTYDPLLPNPESQVYIQGKRIKSTDNVYKGFGGYAERIRGDGSMLMGERFIETNPNKIPTRGPMFFDPDFNGTGTGEYHAYNNFADLGRYQSEGSNRLLYIISYNNTAGIHSHNNMASHPDVRPLYQTTAPVLPTLLGTVGNNRFWSATTPPASGNQIGDVCYNPAPTTAYAIIMWIATGGSTWRAVGHGSGTTAQRPALTTNDAGYGYKDTTIDRDIRWSGTAWAIYHEPRVLFTGTAARTVANTVTETALNPTGVGTLALPANYYSAGSGTRYLYHGTIRTTGTPTLRLRFRTVAGVIVIDTSAITMPTLPVVSWRAECAMICRTTGASGVMLGVLNFTFNTGVGITAVNAIEAPPATATVDTTAAQTPYLSAEWGTASTLNSMVTQSLVVETLY